MKLMKNFKESKDLILFKDLSFENKVNRLTTSPYEKEKFYHVTSKENVQNILREGSIRGDEIWVTKSEPHEDYYKGYLIELNLENFDLKRDPRWKSSHEVYITTESIDTNRITKIFSFLEEVDYREDIIASWGISKSKAEDFILEYNL